jgi:chaperonin GroEL
VEIVKKAIQSPIRQIVDNAGVEASIVVGKLLEQTSTSFGYNAQSETYVDLLEAGIVDPTKVVRVALQNAASIASLVITTEAVITEVPKKDPPPAMPAGGMGGMDY